MDMDYTIEELNLSYKDLLILPDLSKYTKLKILKCSNNQITRLDNLPLGLLELRCSDNQITSLDNLHPGLIKLYCGSNQITSLDNLPLGLKGLYCYCKQKTKIDNFLSQLKILNEKKISKK